MAREASVQDLEGWVAGYLAGTKTGADLARTILLSAEFEARSLTHEEYVTLLYAVMWGETPDLTGLEGYVSALESGTDPALVLEEFVYSPEFAALCSALGIETYSEVDLVLDLTGTWTGTWVSEMYPGLSGPIQVTLTQVGAKLTGTGYYIDGGTMVYGVIEGIVTNGQMIFGLAYNDAGSSTFAGTATQDQIDVSYEDTEPDEGTATLYRD